MDKRIVQYPILVAIIAGLLFTSFMVQGKLFRLLLIASISLVYLLFGVLHHYEEKNLSVQIFLEYLALSSLAFVVLYSTLLAG